jgi:hypothetical protein
MDASPIDEIMVIIGDLRLLSTSYRSGRIRSGVFTPAHASRRMREILQIPAGNGVRTWTSYIASKKRKILHVSCFVPMLYQVLRARQNSCTVWY